MAYEDLPVIFCCPSYTLESIIKTGGILSKQELIKRKIPFVRNTSSPEGLEPILNTNNDVTLYVDKTFERVNIYGGFGCPRIILDESLLFKEDVFILPSDQYRYDPRREDCENWHFKFESDKRKTKESKIKLLKEYRESDGKVPLEVHVPTQVELKYFKMILVNKQELLRYSNNKKLSHIEIKPIDIDYSKVDFRKPHIPSFNAYFSTLSKAF